MKQAVTGNGTFQRNDDGSVTFIPPLAGLNSKPHWTRESWELIQVLTAEDRLMATVTAPYDGNGAPA